MSSKITTVISFKIKGRFKEWVKIFDIKEVNLRESKFDIKPLFRGFSKDDPKKLFVHMRLKRGIFESLFKQIVNGLKVKMLISQIWNNHLRYESF